jgi:hypothetical protein
LGTAIAPQALHEWVFPSLIANASIYPYIAPFASLGKSNPASLAGSYDDAYASFDNGHSNLTSSLYQGASLATKIWTQPMLLKATRTEPSSPEISYKYAGSSSFPFYGVNFTSASSAVQGHQNLYSQEAEGTF